MMQRGRRGGCLCAESSRACEVCKSSRWSYRVRSDAHGDMPPHLLCAARMVFSNTACSVSVGFCQCLRLLPVQSGPRISYERPLSRGKRCVAVRRRGGSPLFADSQ
jgi:hypothetical protein